MNGETYLRQGAVRTETFRNVCGQYVACHFVCFKAWVAEDMSLFKLQKVSVAYLLSSFL